MIGDGDFIKIIGVAFGDREIGGKLGAAIWWNDFGEGSYSSSTNMTVILSSRLYSRVPN